MELPGEFVFQLSEEHVTVPKMWPAVMGGWKAGQGTWRLDAKISVFPHMGYVYSSAVEGAPLVLPKQASEFL